MAGKGQVQILYYLVLDASYSMVSFLEQLQQAIEELVAELSLESIFAGHARLAIITFSDEARVDLSLTPWLEVFVSGLPRLQARGGGTAYGPAFSATARHIREDIARLKCEGFRVTRPTVFFLTDGEPTDPPYVWHAALAELKDSKANVIAIGVGSVDPGILSSIATRRGFALVSAGGSDSGSIASSFASLLRSLATSVTSSVVSGSTEASVSLPHGLVAVPDFLA